ncbi:MAG: cupin domain-containing protein [Trueperaceae bacterium]|nr:cupin domain-containing protein [Trueperaceae bacterium]
MKTIGRCKITRNEDVDQLRFDWGTLHFLSDENATGAKSFSFGHVELAVGKGHVRHNHPDADEIIYVMSGEGDQMLDDEPAVHVKKGDSIWIPKGIYHSTINQGSEPMHLLVVYAPAGAEQVLWQDPGVTVLKPGQH